MTISTNHFSFRAPGYFTLNAFTTLLIAAISHPCVAQTTSASVAAAAPSSQITALRTDVRRVDVDVVVTDSKGRPVSGLTQQDFKVEEDKTPQTLRFLDVHTLTPEANYIAPKIPALPPNTFLNLLKAPESGTPTVILYDALNTPIAEQLFGHQQMLNLLRHRRPGTPIAIFILIDKLHLLQGFTEDTSLLSVALASKKGSPQTATLLAPSSGFAGTPMSGDDSANIDQALDDFLAKAREFDEVNQLRLQDQRVEITLNALTDIGRFLASMPGRKEVIWLSSAFPVGILPDPNLIIQDPASPVQGTEVHDRDMRDYSGQIRHATDMLNLSHVSVYPVDTRGLRINSDLTASSNASYGSNPTFGGAAVGLKQTRTMVRATTSNNMNLSQQTFILEDEATRKTMDSIADQTGGHAFYGTNGLQEAVNTAMLSGSTYYSLNYLPTNAKYDGTLRHIKVTLKRSGYNLSYRKTYFADDLAAAAHAVADAPENPLTPSLERGTPLSHGLFLEAHLDAVGAPVPATPAQMQVLSQYETMQSKKTTQKAKKSPTAPCILPVVPSATALPVIPKSTALPVIPNSTVLPVILSVAKDPRICPSVLMQQYYISYGLIARQLQMPVDDTGAHLSSLEMAVIAYDEDGRKLNGQDTQIDDPIPAPRYAKLANDGYHVVQSIAVPVTASSIRLAVRDIRGNRTGSLEVQLPLAKTANVLYE